MYRTKGCSQKKYFLKVNFFGGGENDTENQILTRITNFEGFFHNIFRFYIIIKSLLKCYTQAILVGRLDKVKTMAEQGGRVSSPAELSNIQNICQSSVFR